jgi:Opacity protein and related surface antigens
MKTLSRAVFTALIAAAAANSMADVVAEKNYALVRAGIYQFGDDLLDEALGNATIFTASASFNVAAQIDAHGAMQYITASKNDFDVTGLQVGGGATYWFKPGAQINPYAGAGVFVSKSEVKYSGIWTDISEDDTNIGFTVGGGAEFDIAPKVLLSAGLDFETCDGESDVNLIVNAAYAVAQNIYLGGSVGYWFDEGDMAVMAGLAFLF